MYFSKQQPGNTTWAERNLILLKTLSLEQLHFHVNSPQSKSIYCTSYGINFYYFQIKVTLGKKKHKQKQTKKNKSSKQLPAPEKKKSPLTQQKITSQNQTPSPKNTIIRNPIDETLYNTYFSKLRPR